MSEKIFLLDGYGIIYRYYFAFLRSPLYNEKGENVSALLGFFRSLFTILKTEQPSHLLVAMDAPWPTFRHDIYKEYKANRDETPQDLRSQIKPIWSILEALGVPVIQLQGYEADDIMGTYAQQALEKGWDARIVSADKDLLQLVNKGIHVLRPEKGNLREIDPQGVFDDRGVFADQIIDYLALIGDASDNIPGVAGIGPKTAVKLLNEFKTLEGIYENIEKISSKSQRQKLTDQKEMAFFSQKLVTIKLDVPLEQSLEDLTLKSPDSIRVLELFKELGLNSLVDDFSKLYDLSEQEKNDQEILEFDAQRCQYHWIDREEDLIHWLDRADKALFLSLDTETDSLNPMEAELAGISLSIKPGEACYIPVQASNDDPIIEPQRLKELLIPFFTHLKAKLIGQNLKYDKKVLLNWGLDIGPIYFDTMVAAWVLETHGQYNLDYLAQRYLKYRMIPFSAVVPKGKVFRDIPKEDALNYAAEDADITLQLFEKLKPMIQEAGMNDLFYHLEMPLIDVLVSMEMKGIAINSQELKDYSLVLGEELSRIEKETFALAGREFNMQSPKQLQEILFEERNLPPQKKTKTGYSTDTSVLEFLSALDPVPELILKSRTLTKLKSTYVDRLPEQINSRTGRIHTSFLLTGTATGRMSSKDPNLQNIPIRDERGRKIRSAFQAPPGRLLLSADYSQIELVMLAHLSGDPGLNAAFTQGVDVHSQTAALIFHCPPDEVREEQRRIAKTINFGVIYGMSAFRLSNELKISRKEASTFIDTYFNEYSGVRDFIDKSIEEAEHKGGVYTLAGRFRSIPAINSRNKTEKSGAQRMAVNTIIQGSAADLVKKAMLAIHKHIEKNYKNLNLLLQVHDEFIFELDKADLPRFQEELTSIMVGIENIVCTLAGKL